MVYMVESEKVAYDWLVNEEGLEEDKIVRESPRQTPDFIYGKKGYEVKTRNGKSVKVRRSQVEDLEKYDTTIIVVDDGEVVSTFKWEDREKHNVFIPNKVNLLITVKPELKDKVERIADICNLSKSRVAEALIKEGLGESSILSTAPKTLEEIRERERERRRKKKEEEADEENVIEESDWLEIREKVIETEQRR